MSAPRRLHHRLAARLLPGRSLSVAESRFTQRLCRGCTRRSFDTPPNVPGRLRPCLLIVARPRHIRERASATAGSIIDRLSSSRSLTRSHHEDPNGVTVPRWSGPYQSVELEALSRPGEPDKAPLTCLERRIKNTSTHPIGDFCLAPLPLPRHQRRTRGAGGFRHHVLPRREPTPIRPCPTRPIPGSEPAERPAFVFCSPPELRPR